LTQLALKRLILLCELDDLLLETIILRGEVAKAVLKLLNIRLLAGATVSGGFTILVLATLLLPILDLFGRKPSGFGVLTLLGAQISSCGQRDRLLSWSRGCDGHRRGRRRSLCFPCR